MKFTKMHGLGNDYVYINLFQEQVKDLGALSIALSDRHTGAGSDGIITIGPSRTADFRMRMFNADGSEGKMCGNGIRCLGKYVYDHGMTAKDCITVETLGGTKILNLTVTDGKVSLVRVDMGRPSFAAADIPAIWPKEEIIEETIEVQGRIWQMTGVSVGNPHCVVWTEDPMKLDLPQIGPDFENMACFPERVNTEFIRIIDRKNLQMRVWERGSGETMACGTGACASAAAAIRTGKTEESVTVHLLGGDLLIEWDKEQDTLFMTGPAETVYEAEFDPSFLKKANEI